MIAVLMVALAVTTPAPVCNDQVTIVTVPGGQVAAAEWRIERGGPVGHATVAVFTNSVCRRPDTTPAQQTGTGIAEKPPPSHRPTPNPVCTPNGCRL